MILQEGEESFMKRNVFRRTFSLLLTLLVALGMTTTVFAGEAKSGDVVFFADGEVYLGYTEAYVGAYSEGDYDVTLDSVSSSNPNVATVYKKDGEYFVKGVALGKVTITGNYTYRGQKGSLSVPLEVKKIPVLFKSLKVNGKKVSLSKHPFGTNKKVKKATSVKVKAKVASGWKIQKVGARAYKGWKDYKGTKIKVSKKNITKGKKIKFAKKYTNMLVEVRLVNTSTGEKQWYVFQFYRKTPFAK